MTSALTAGFPLGLTQKNQAQAIFDPANFSGMFNPPGPPAPPAATSAPTISDPSVQAAAQVQATSAAQAAGRSSTILTSGQGDTSTATIKKSTLLGGG